MARKTSCIGFALLGAIVSGVAAPALAVITVGGDGRNTSAPTGNLAGSGWQYQGNFNSFVGTPIAPGYFITAQHIGGSVGQTFSYQGADYETVASFDDPGSDLRIWKVDGTFDAFAPLYRSHDETGKNVVVFGRGTQRGDAVTVNGTPRGWQAGASDGALSWGTNTVSEISSGTLIRSAFDAGAGPDEGTLSSGDSGGGVFVNDGGTWKLAGVNYAVDGPFSVSGTDGSGFNGAIFDAGGLYSGGDGNWTYHANTAADIAAGFYSTRISTQADWIDSILGRVPNVNPLPPTDSNVPEPAGLALLGTAAGALFVRRRHGAPSRR
jgi:hypothetical protein